MTTRRWTARPARRAIAVVTGIALLVAVPRGAAAPTPPREDLHGPLGGPVRVVTPYDPPPEPWLPGHRGVDLSADRLAGVRAPADGTVSFAGPVAGRPVLSLDHGGGLRTTYEPVRALVEVGEEIVTGQLVGRVLAGHPGCPVGACLHWGARVAAGDPAGDDDEYVDPMTLLRADQRPIRLKSLHPGDGDR